jgi:phenylpropionate dioxygenase-like ring-hydroxylating dioxygenase large terminal subunit
MPVQERFKVREFPVQIKYGFLWIYYGDENNVLSEIPFFDELKVGYIYSEFSEVWLVHYTRAVENQLDVAHLPFVDNSTIGRGQKTLVHGPVIEWEKEKMTFYVKNANDDGMETPQKPDEIRPYKQLFSLQYQVPNIWQNKISDKLRIMAAFAPIDDSHTRIYLRTYQSIMKMPLVGHLLANIFQLGNKVILHQDRRVVICQRPIKSVSQMDENLIQADLPIIEFRRKRKELQIKEANHKEGDSYGIR